MDTIGAFRNKYQGYNARLTDKASFEETLSVLLGEKKLKQKYFELAKQNPDKNIVEILGYNHIYIQGRRLSDFNPAIITLAEWDSYTTQSWRKFNEGVHYSIPKIKASIEYVTPKFEEGIKQTKKALGSLKEKLGNYFPSN